MTNLKVSIITVYSKRITRDLSDKLALLLTNHKVKEIYKLRDEIEARVLEVEITKIDKKLLEIFKKYRSYFKDTAYNLSDYSGTKLSRMHFNLEIPRKANNHRTIDIAVIKDKKLAKMCSNLSTSVSEYWKNVSTIGDAIYSMKSLSKLESDFVEAFNLIELKEKPTLPALPLDDVRKYISK